MLGIAGTGLRALFGRLLGHPTCSEPDGGTRVSLETLLALRGLTGGLRLHQRGRSSAPLAGDFVSVFRGRGLDFDELRAYAPGDDIRDIDWQVTARTGRAHTRRYREERERPVYLCVDLREGMRFGTRHVLKSVLASRAAALLAWTAADRGDRVGGLVFSDRHLMMLRPRGGRQGVLRLLQALVDVHESPPETNRPALDLTHALQRLPGNLPGGALLVLISDFQGLDTAAARTALSQLAHRADVMGIFIYDPLEADPPPAGIYPVSDGTDVRLWDLRSETARDAHRTRFDAHQALVTRTLIDNRMHLLRLSTGHTLDASLRRVLDLRTPARTGNLR